MTPTQATRYLSLLGVPPAPPSLAALTGLVTGHLARVPFENISKLIRHARGGQPVVDPLDEFLDRIEHLHLGGTCYACAVHFNALLRHLGYDARLCGAAMSRPDVHVVNIVRFGEREYLVDVGYGAPLFEPLPLDSGQPVTVERASETYVLGPRGADGRSRLEHLRDGEFVHGYTVDPTPRNRDHFAAAIADSFRPDAEFLNRLRIVLHHPERSIELANSRATVTEGGTVRTRILADRGTVRDVVTVLFRIPGDVTAEAMAALWGSI